MTSMILKCTEPELEELIRHMNNQHQNIQFTHEYSKSEINFLDVTICKDLERRDKLQVRTFIKPTNKQLYIRNLSHHPPGATRGVAFGEAIRYLRTNTDKCQFYKMLILHKRSLLNRGYPRSLINETMKKVKFSMREEKMKPKCNKNKHNKDGERPTFVTRYSSRDGRVYRIVQKHWTLMHSDQYHIQKYQCSPTGQTLA